MIGAGSQSGGEQIELHSTAFIIVWDIRANDSIVVRRVQAKMRGHRVLALHSRDDSSPGSGGIPLTADVKACACLPAYVTKPGRPAEPRPQQRSSTFTVPGLHSAHGAQGVATAGAVIPRHSDFSLNWIASG